VPASLIEQKDSMCARRYVEGDLASLNCVSSRCRLIASLLHLGMTMPAALPSAGQIAPNSHGKERR
jgi:hypothetical protein